MEHLRVSTILALNRRLIDYVAVGHAEDTVNAQASRILSQ